MDIYTTKPKKEIDKRFFKILGKPVEIHPHATNHLGSGQRKVFKEQELLDMVEKETPRKVYLQENGRYAAFYRRSDGYRKLILSLEKTKTVIVTFMDTPELPKYKVSK